MKFIDWLKLNALPFSIVLAATIFGLFFLQSHQTVLSAQVVGVATQRQDSDLVKWRVTVSRNISINDYAQGYTLIERDKEALLELLLSKGLKADEISVDPVSVTEKQDRDGFMTGYLFSIPVLVSTINIDVLQKVALNPSAMVAKNIIPQYSSLEYYITGEKLQELKRTLIEKATSDAKKRAESIAKGSGKKVGALNSAKVGVFQITEPNSTEVSDYGIYSTNTKIKDVSITVNASYNLN